MAFELDDLPVLHPRGDRDADVLPVDGDDPFVGGMRLFQGEVKLRLVVAALGKKRSDRRKTVGRNRNRRPPPKKRIRRSRKSRNRSQKPGLRQSLQKTAKARTRLALVAPARVLSPGLFVGVGMLPVLSVLVVFFAFIRIAQDLVGLVDLLEFFVRFLVVGIEVGVKLPGQFAIGLFDILRGGVFSPRPIPYSNL